MRLPDSTAVLGFIIALLVSTSEAASDSTIVARSGRSLLRSVGIGDDLHLPDVTVELNASNFNTVLQSYTTVQFAMLEFFATWCPACRNYKPHYEKVARVFNGPDAAHPGFVVMARVDCALQINSDLCERFSVLHFPHLLWSAPAKFASGSWDPKTAQNEIKLVDDIRPADHLLNWINKQLGSSFSLEDKRYDPKSMPLSNASIKSNAIEVAEAIYDVEETTAAAFDIIFSHKIINKDNQAQLIKFLQILVAHHPSKRCRRGSAELLMNFDELFPPNFHSVSSLKDSARNNSDALKRFYICGKDIPRGNWRFCRGSRNDTRGFSCGLWVLLHSLSVRVGDGEGQTAFTDICNFIHNFFRCDECRQHFHEMCSKEHLPINSTQDLSLWLWKTHNKVNRRVKNEENSLGTGDPKFPKVTWPSKELCPSCYISQGRKKDGTIKTNWNKDEVFNFLTRYYGPMLISSYKDTIHNSNEISKSSIINTSTSANVDQGAPVGTALGLTFACCCFVVLTCFWRTMIWNRKYFYKTQLKHI